LLHGELLGIHNLQVLLEFLFCIPSFNLYHVFI
jgi:hypothetical protein